MTNVSRVIKRYTRLFMYFLQFSLSKAMEFRLDFSFRIIMDMFFYVIIFSTFKILYLHTPSFGGFTETEGIVFAASTMVFDSMMMIFLGNNMYWFPIYINKGDLDYYLIRPVSSQFFLGLREMAANSFFNLFMAIGVFIWSISQLGTPLPWINIFAFVCLSINSLYLYYLLRMTFLLPIFFTQSERGLDEIFFPIQLIWERPDGIFQGNIRNVFTYIIPVFLIISFPVRILLFGIQTEIILTIIGVTIGLSIVFNFLWRYALKNYSSASS
jgi:ABC-2 type transport system permease protein